jgi:hypothetical protein
VDLKEFLLTDQFREYHRLQALRAAEVLHGLLMSRDSHLKPNDITGAMLMARKLHQMPFGMYQEDKYNEALVARLKIDEVAMTASLARKFLE